MMAFAWKKWSCRSVDNETIMRTGERTTIGLTVVSIFVNLTIGTEGCWFTSEPERSHPTSPRWRARFHTGGRYPQSTIRPKDGKPLRLIICDLQSRS
jgi:hypothetical protein